MPGKGRSRQTPAHLSNHPSSVRSRMIRAGWCVWECDPTRSSDRLLACGIATEEEARALARSVDDIRYQGVDRRHLRPPFVFAYACHGRMVLPDSVQLVMESVDEETL